MKNHNINTVASNYERACSLKSYRGRIQSRFIKRNNRDENNDNQMRKLSTKKAKIIPPIRL